MVAAMQLKQGRMPGTWRLSGLLWVLPHLVIVMTGQHLGKQPGPVEELMEHEGNGESAVGEWG